MALMKKEGHQLVIPKTQMAHQMKLQLTFENWVFRRRWVLQKIHSKLIEQLVELTKLIASNSTDMVSHELQLSQSLKVNSIKEILEQQDQLKRRSDRKARQLKANVAVGTILISSLTLIGGANVFLLCSGALAGTATPSLAAINTMKSNEDKFKNLKEIQL